MCYLKSSGHSYGASYRCVLDTFVCLDTYITSSFYIFYIYIYFINIFCFNVIPHTYVSVHQHSKVGETGDAGSGRGRGQRKRKDKKKNRKVLNQAHTPGQKHYTHSSSHTTVEDLCLTTHRDFCVHGYCKFMEDLREPLCM